MNTAICKSLSFLKEQGLEPDVAVILGTGMGGSFLNELKIISEFDYSEIPEFPVPTVRFHRGKLYYGKLSGKKVVVFNGRFHYYEGFEMENIVFPVRIARLLNCRALLISNAAGNLNPNWKKGELMLIDDHINLFPGNPLIGANNEDLGPRFPDMIEPYDSRLGLEIQNIARKRGIVMRKGVYAGVTGPMLETRAEYRYLMKIGADAVGMSTVPEVIAAVHCGLPCCAISVLTDDCNPDDLQPVNISEILSLISEAEPKLTSIFKETIKKI